MGRPALAPGESGLVSTHVEALDPATGRWVRASAVAVMARSRWAARCRVRDADGVVRQVRCTGPTRAAAEQALSRVLAERSARAPRRLVATTRVADVVPVWLTALDGGAVRPGTRDLYRRSAAAHLVPRLGLLQVRQLSAVVVERWLSEVADRSGPASARTARSCLRGVVELALASGALDADPLAGAAVPAGPVVGEAPAPGAPVARVLSEDEEQHLLSVAAADPEARRHGLPDLMAVLLATGARLGEVLALRWSAVALDAGVLSVAASVERASGCATRVRPLAAVREVPLGPGLVALLAARRAAVVAASRSEAAADAALLFPTGRGTVADPAATTRRLRRAFDAAGLVGVTSHALRATRAQRLLDQGLEPAAVAQLLGTTRLRTGEVPARPTADDLLTPPSGAPAVPAPRASAPAGPVGFAAGPAVAGLPRPRTERLHAVQPAPR